MLVAGDSFAVGAEICVVADSTFVANASNVGLVLFVLAKRAVTEDAVMPDVGRSRVGQWLVNWYESMRRMKRIRVFDACGAVVKVRAVQALVADAIYVLHIVSSTSFCK